MAKNTGKSYRRGSVTGRSESHNPRTKLWTKRGPDGKFMDVKTSGGEHKGVRNE